ncbi:phosphate acetyltransferase [Actinocatenispora rupis]|uniref:Phosphate acetyltransferase n=1 Tax=Actinocatenispora rupis TaxID=519421 RepID=A0A8J3NCK5_9ACTN|nr:phosphate acetyltransferase [Actinocatenispora rupis]
MYVAGLGPGGGKSLVALGVAELLSRRVERVGVFRPLVADEGADPIVELLRRRYRPDADPADLTGVGRAESDALLGAGRTDDLVAAVVDRYRRVERDSDAVLVIGSDFGDRAAAHDDPGMPAELGLNVRLATEFGAPLLLVVDGHRRGAAATAASVRSGYHTVIRLGGTVLAVVANRVPADDRDRLLTALAADVLPVPVYAVPEVPAVAAPTVAEVTAALSGRLLLGDDTAASRDVLGYVLGGAGVPVFLAHLRTGHLVITPGDRADLLLAAFAAHASGTVSLAGVVLTLGEVPDARVLRVAERLGTGLAVSGVGADSFVTAATLAGLEGRITADNPRTVTAALGAFERSVDSTALADRIAVTRSTRRTPLMFEYELIERARADRRHVVLPEGTDARVLAATEVLLRRGVADLTLLGDPDDIARRARELGVDVRGARILDPATDPLRTGLADLLYARRRARGTTRELAYDQVADPTWFGTLLVESGRADAMVSGAAHTTADTLRPAFQLIRTVPGVSVASSVFFMCLADRVLVYGDCAVNPDPDPTQLADIAISSAGTAARFGVEPRVAMLSYSTGTSGHGADVTKVAEATALVRDRRPDLPVAGPVQYDTAVSESVAAAKLPGDPVAGRATVLIFPDLNTGNNTYKAVQRSAGAVAVGPVVQGLRRPVNDLSRGATVTDIVTTVAITAIQAQPAT